MANLRMDPEHSESSFTVSWEEDRQYRTNPVVVTELLREQVPVLEFVQYRIAAIEPGATRALVPLNPQSTNQHFTHQAALFVLAADYTGGTALGSLIMGWPVVGVHPVTSSKSMSLWLLKVEIKYLRPSVGDLVVVAEIAPARHERIRRRFLSKKPVIESVPISFWNGETQVAEAVLTYFARQSEAIRAKGIDDENVNTLYELKLTSSAEMIAGVRARESGNLFEDPYAAQMAGQHGIAVAARFCERLPQLGGMVAARTHHLDREILRFLSAGGRHLVFLGIGWDMRPFRLPLPAGTRVFELDFPTTLTERDNRIAELAIEQPPDVARIGVPIDLRTMSLETVLRDYLSFDEPVFVAWEGMSMYFDEQEVQAVLAGIRQVLQNPESRLWVDLVDRDPIRAPEDFAPEVLSFVRGMQILGEPFIFGVNSVKGFMEANGFTCQQVVSSGTFLNGDSDDVHDLYRFCVASPAPHTELARDRSAPAVRIDAADGGAKWSIDMPRTDQVLR